jgi:hypothetical protein
MTGTHIWSRAKHVFLDELREHRIDLEPDPRRHGPTIMRYQGKEIGRSKEPILAAARWLLDNGLPWPDETRPFTDSTA